MLVRPGRIGPRLSVVPLVVGFPAVGRTWSTELDEHTARFPGPDQARNAIITAFGPADAGIEQQANDGWRYEAKAGCVRNPV